LLLQVYCKASKKSSCSK